MQDRKKKIGSDWWGKRVRLRFLQFPEESRMPHLDEMAEGGGGSKERIIVEYLVISHILGSTKITEHVVA